VVKKFAIGCLVVVGAFVVVSVGIGIINGIVNPTKTQQTPTVTETLIKTTTVAQPQTTRAQQTTTPVFEGPIPSIPPLTPKTSAPQKTENLFTQIEAELVSAQSEGLIDVAGYGTGLGTIRLTIASKSNMLLHIRLLPGTVFDSQPVGAKSSVITLVPMDFLITPHRTSSPFSASAACLNLKLSVPNTTDTLTMRATPASGYLSNLLSLPDFQNNSFRIRQLAIWTISDNPQADEYLGTGYSGLGSNPTTSEINTIRSLFEKAGIPTEEYKALRPPITLELIEARNKGLVDISAYGTGSINRIKLSLTSKSDDTLKISIITGTVFVSGMPGIQNMVVVQRDVSILVYPHKTTSAINIDAACANMELKAPDESQGLASSIILASDHLTKLLNLPDFQKESARVKQFAIWTITDNPKRDGYMGIATGYSIFGTGPSDEEIARIRTLFQIAGILSFLRFICHPLSR
jgi:hypothetical protein